MVGMEAPTSPAGRHPTQQCKGKESPSNGILRPSRGPPEAGKRVNGQAPYAVA